jgi:plasmid maintenance system killer protein
LKILRATSERVESWKKKSNNQNAEFYDTRGLIFELQNEKSKLLQKLEKIHQSNQSVNLDSLETSFFKLKLEREKKLEEQSISLNTKNILLAKFEDDIETTKLNIHQLEELRQLCEKMLEERICGPCIDSNQ